MKLDVKDMEKRTMYIKYYNDSGLMCTSYYPGYVSHRFVTIDGSSQFIEITYNIRTHGINDEVIITSRTERILWERIHSYSIALNYSALC